MAWIMLTSFVWQIIWPTTELLALTGGPSQPDFASFEPVSTSNMVDPLTGQFTYNLPVLNVPGPNGGGYALSLSYHSGVTPEQEASWVGLGWSLTPGSIVRQKQGYPDEYKGADVRFWNKTKPTITTSVSASFPPEVFGQTFKDLNAVEIALRYNNHKGYKFVAGSSADVKGLATLNFSVGSEGPEASLSSSIGVGGLLNGIDQLTQKPTNSKKFIASTWNKDAKRVLNRYIYPGLAFVSSTGSSNSPHVHPYIGTSVNVSASVHAPLPLVPAGGTVAVGGHWSRQDNVPWVKGNAFGYMYSGHAGEYDYMDYRVEKDNGFDKRDEFLGLPLRAYPKTHWG